MCVCVFFPSPRSEKFEQKNNIVVRSKIRFFCRSPRKRRSRSRSGSRKRKHRKRSRSRSRERKRKSSRSYSSERRAREREKERQKKGLPPIRSKTLSGKWHIFTELWFQQIVRKSLIAKVNCIFRLRNWKVIW